VLWRFQRLEYIGVQRREGAPEPTGPFTGPASRAAARTTARGVDPDVALTGVAANTWALDRKRLVEAVAHFAPPVEVADTATGQLLYPAPPAPARVGLTRARRSASSGRSRPGPADLGDGRPDRALAERAGDRDAVVPVEHVVVAAAPVQLDRVHATAAADVGGYPLKTFPRQLRGGAEMAVEAHDRLDRPDDAADRHRLLAGPPGAARVPGRPGVSRARAGRAGDDRHLTEHRQAVRAEHLAAQPLGQLGPPRLPQGAVKIVPGIGPGEPGLHDTAPATRVCCRDANAAR
jgi:hypothetical protein